MVCPGINGTCSGRGGRVTRRTQSVTNETSVLCDACSAQLHNTDGGDRTVPHTAMAAMSQNDYIFNPLLCYVVSARNNSRKNDIAHLVSGFFSAEAIENAKTELWNNASHDIIGTELRRRNTDDRSSKEAHVQDIIDALRKLEDADALPLFAVTSDQLAQLPRSQPGELLDYSVSDRVARLETKLNRVIETVDFLSNENAALRDKMSSSETTAPLVRVTVDPPTPVIRDQSPDVASVEPQTASEKQKSFAKAAAEKPAKRHKARKPNNTKTDSKMMNTREHCLNPLGNLRSILGSLAGSNTSLYSNDTDGFQLPNEQTRRMRRADQKPTKRRHNVITGKGTQFKSLKVGAEPNRDIYVSRVCLTTTQDDVREFLNNEDIEIRDLDVISDPKWLTKSFKVTVAASQLQKVLDANWPEGICVRRFFPPRSKSAAANTTD